MRDQGNNNNQGSSFTVVEGGEKVSTPMAEEYATILAGVHAELVTIRGRLDVLVRLEVEHNQTKESLNRAFEELRKVRTDFKQEDDKLDVRLLAVEHSQPANTLTTKLVMGVAWLVLAAVVVAVVGLVVIKTPLLP